MTDDKQGFFEFSQEQPVDPANIDFSKLFDPKKFQVRIYDYLTHGDLNPTQIEHAIATSIDGEWCGNDDYAIDVAKPKNNLGVSVKSKKIPLKKLKQKYDFFSNSAAYHKGGKEKDEYDLDNVNTIISRVSFPEINDQADSLDTMGNYMLSNYKESEKESIEKYKCNTIIDSVVLHGISHDVKRYLMRAMFFKHDLNPIIKWEESIFGAGAKKGKVGKRSGILGYDANGPHFGRYSDISMYATCTYRFYRKTEALYSIDMIIPYPDAPLFDYDAALKKMTEHEQRFLTEETEKNILFDQS